MIKTYWQDKFAGWRSSDSVHYRWRRNVARFLEKKANEEKRRNEKEQDSGKSKHTSDVAQ